MLLELLTGSMTSIVTAGAFARVGEVPIVLCPHLTRYKFREVKMARKPAVDPLLLGNQICFAVYSTAHAFNRVYKPLLDRIGLTYPQYLAMLVLWERDGLAVKAIGDQLFLDSGTLTPLLKRFESAGLVERRRSRDDEREVQIPLTPQGHALREKARAVPEGIFASSACSLGGIVCDEEGTDRVARQAERGVGGVGGGSG